jgi:hypothetical protein
MADPEAIAARLNEDGRRIAAEKGDCTETDLTRLGWRLEQVKAHQADLARDWARLDAELSEAVGPVRAAEADVVPLARGIREPDLADMDIAFGIERAA